MDIINKDKFEELLLKNWTSFIDFKKLIAFVMKNVRDSEFPVVKIAELKVKGTQVTLSRFTLTPAGFSVWAEFSIPKGDLSVVGTTEFRLHGDGTAEHVQTIGTAFQKNAI